MAQNQKKILSSSTLEELGPWTARMGKFLSKNAGVNGSAVSGSTIIFRLYLMHITTGGRGIMKIPGLGKKKYEEIRHILMRHGFPDLDEGVFFFEFAGSDDVKAALGTMLDSWKKASSRAKVNLRKTLANLRLD